VFDAELGRAVLEFTTLMLPLSGKDLEREWRWKDHDEGGNAFSNPTSFAAV